jgi:hypothetical protein
MKLAVYKPGHRRLPLVLTPACMRPSLETEQRFGHLEMEGAVALDERLLAAIAQRVSSDDEWLEYVIYNGPAIRCIEGMLGLAPKAETGATTARDEAAGEMREA